MMDSADNLVNVRISKRVLWVGTEAYPLQNIARAQAVKVIPKSPWTGKSRAAGGCLGFIAFWMVVALGAALHSVGAVLFVAAVIAAVIIVVLARRKKQPYYALIIETSGNPRRALVSTDGAKVGNLVQKIMDAIDDPEAEFQTVVHNVQYGDNFVQVGDRNVGKVGL
jgi:Family of unknown function (DUF6232)